MNRSGCLFAPSLVRDNPVYDVATSGHTHASTRSAYLVLARIAGNDQMHRRKEAP
jgi:hypothetical protein